MKNNTFDFGDYFQQLPFSDAMKSFLQKEFNKVKEREKGEFKKSLSKKRTWKFSGKWLSIIASAFLFVNYFYTQLHPYALLFTKIYGYFAIFATILTLILGHWFLNRTKNITPSNFDDNLMILFLGYPFKSTLTFNRVSALLLILIYQTGLILNQYYLLSGILITVMVLAFVLKKLDVRMMRNKLKEMDREYFAHQTS